MKGLSTDIILTVLGVATTVLTAFLLYVIEQHMGFSLYTWHLWFILPVGAMVSGLAAGTGYWFGARLLNRRPTGRLRVIIVLLSISTFFLIHFLSYASTEVDGSPLINVVSFADYLNIVHTHTSMTFRIHAKEIGSTGELGIWGYGYGLLEILGFALGGIFLYNALRDLPYCASCERYLTRVSRETRYIDDQNTLKEFLDQAAAFVSASRISELVSAHQSFGVGKAAKSAVAQTQLNVWRCKDCTQRFVRLVTSKRSGNKWKEVPELRVESVTHAPIITERNIA